MPTTCSIHSANNSLAKHLVRGALAALAIGFAFRYTTTNPVLALLAVIAGVIALGGCPGCWLAGLISHIMRRGDSSPQSSR